MLFTHDTDVSLSLAAALVNTAGGTAEDTADDAMTTVEDLRGFLRSWEDTGTAPLDDAAVGGVRTLRTTLRSVWEAGEAQVVETVNALLADGEALPRLVRHDGYGWHVHATPDHATPATRLGVEVAMALVDVVRAGELDRLGTCGRTGCGNVLVDLSRNRSRRFCEGGCANRTHAAAYRARQRA